MFADGTAAEEASDNGSDAGDADMTADKATAFASKLRIVTTKVRLVVVIILYSCREILLVGRVRSLSVREKCSEAKASVPGASNKPGD